MATIKKTTVTRATTATKAVVSAARALKVQPEREHMQLLLLQNPNLLWQSKFRCIFLSGKV